MAFPHRQPQGRATVLKVLGVQKSTSAKEDISPSTQLTAILIFSRVFPSHSPFVANDTVISHMQLAFLLLCHCCFYAECCSACFCIHDGYAAPDAFGSFGDQYDIARQMISGPGIKGGIEFLVNISSKVGACGLRISNMTASAHEVKMLTVGDLCSWLCMEASEREAKAEEDWESCREHSDNMISTLMM